MYIYIYIKVLRLHRICIVSIPQANLPKMQVEYAQFHVDVFLPMAHVVFALEAFVHLYAACFCFSQADFVLPHRFFTFLNIYIYKFVIFHPLANLPYRIGTPRCCIKRFFIQVPPQFQLPCLPCFGGLESFLSQTSGSQF